MGSHRTANEQEPKANRRARFTGGLSGLLASSDKTSPASRNRSVGVDDEIANSIPHFVSTTPNLPNPNPPANDPPRPPLPPTAPSQPPRGPDISDTRDSSGSPDHARNPQPRPRPGNSRNPLRTLI